MSTLMRIPLRHILGAGAVLVAAIAVSFIATNAVQRKVAVVSGIEGCARLEGSSRQIECLSDEFEVGSRTATANATGSDRTTLLVTYVRSVEGAAGSDARIAGLCHPAMHRLGRAEGERAAKASHPPAFPPASSQLCTAGYVHGLAEGYLEGTPNANVAAVYPTLCHNASARTGCAHGIGHALVRAQTGDLLNAAAPVAIAKCNGLPGEVRPDCVNGVYMEVAMRTEPAPVPIADYVASCSSTKVVDNELACWSYLGLSITTNDVELSEVPEWCAKASLPGQYKCVEGYGRDLGARRVGECATSGQTQGLRQRCIDGALGLQLTSGHIDAKEARVSCRELTGADLQAYCTRAVKRFSSGKTQLDAA